MKRTLVILAVLLSSLFAAQTPAQATTQAQTISGSAVGHYPARVANTLLTPPSCPSLDNPWSIWKQPAGNWGRFRYCLTVDFALAWVWFYAELDDIATDTYQVHMEKYSACPQACWLDINGIGQTCSILLTYASSGPVTNPCISPTQGTLESPWSGAHWDTDGVAMYVRIVKGRGTYPGPHQFVTYGTYFLGTT